MVDYRESPQALQSPRIPGFVERTFSDFRNLRGNVVGDAEKNITHRPSLQGIIVIVEIPQLVNEHLSLISKGACGGEFHQRFYRERLSCRGHKNAAPF